MRAFPPSRYGVFFTIAIVGCLADLATKSWIFESLGMPGGPVRWIWNGVFGFQTSLNEGALFGLGDGWTGLFAALSGVAAIGILYWLFVVGAASDRLLTIALGSVMGGILGNLYDRLGLWTPPGMPDERIHAVRDWILFQYRGYVWPNFNIADSMLVCGAALLFWHALRHEPPSAPAKTEVPADAAE